MPESSSARIQPFLSILSWSVAIAGAATFLFAREKTGGWVDAATLWHIGGGISLCVIAGSLWLRGRKGQTALPWPPISFVVAITGIILIAWAAAGLSVAHISWIVWLHIASAAIAILFVLIRLFRRRPAAIALAAAGLAPPALALSAYSADAYFRSVTATTAAQAGNPDFPSGARVAHGNWQDGGCVRSGCHSREYLSFSHSPHSRMHVNTAYRTALASASQEIGADGARWCSGCHEPLHSTEPGASECLTCHALGSADPEIGGGSSDYRPPAGYPLERSPWLHDLLIRSRPHPHIATLQTIDDVCLPCHRMRVTPVQNRYQRLNLEDVWGSWQRGPFSGRSLHAPAGTVASKNCVDCHLPLTTERHDHLMAAPSVAYRVEIFALRRGETAPGSMERTDAPLHSRIPALHAGESVSIDVMVRADGVGHAHAPPGLTLQLDARDNNNRVIMTTDPHPYGSAVIDRNGMPVSHQRSYEAIASVYAPTEGQGHGISPSYRAIEPGFPDIVRYRLTIPQGPIHLIATLTIGPRVVASDSIELGGRALSAQPREDASYARRFFEYGLGLLEQNDIPRARRALQQALGLDDSKAAFWVALGRLELQQGDLLAARHDLQEALTRERNSPVANVWLGRVYHKMGQEDAALAVLKSVAAEHPDDAQTWMDIGLCEFNGGRSERAAEAFERVLAIDPEDPSAHLNLMACYRKMNKLSLARIEEGSYRATQQLPAPRSILDRLERTRPDWLREQQLVHEHLLRPVTASR